MMSSFRVAGHLHDTRGEREDVLRLVEQRVVGRLDGVELDAAGIGPQPERDLAAQQVHLVAPPHEMAGQLGGDDAAAAQRGVTDDADLHGRSTAAGQRSTSRGRTTGSRTMKPSANLTPALAPNCASRLSMS